MRITAACPESLIPDANHLAMCLALGPADAQTYGPLNWKDEQGNLYSAASWVARPEWVIGAQTSLLRPAWDVDQIIDMTAAARAQASLVFWDGNGPHPLATPAAMTASVSIPAMAALATMGLVPVELIDPKTVTSPANRML